MTSAKSDLSLLTSFSSSSICGSFSSNFFSRRPTASRYERSSASCASASLAIRFSSSPRESCTLTLSSFFSDSFSFFFIDRASLTFAMTDSYCAIVSSNAVVLSTSSLVRLFDLSLSDLLALRRDAICASFFICAAEVDGSTLPRDTSIFAARTLSSNTSHTRANSCMFLLLLMESADDVDAKDDSAFSLSSIVCARRSMCLIAPRTSWLEFRHTLGRSTVESHSSRRSNRARHA
mmetsp:Transcript_33192/g.75809  ORF Transcript_33192/g.75809 Transcript_33192/m.75809 type:complete len:235 (+) Transcript_33192:751-1455(+)